ncbi:CU044_2847 family protein [Sphaerisporangium sp. TRM90804]|uniref:CU044_2847 family protein n=1 Tax=Sphaerisporangium sp. TRM90804 TaxID=3031113 RepID=UPI0024474582|nr:CU044_2847 family protein [Sphaerisporangium sp. TRM90804]MDH2426891.1 CU044_2847 family protein [Sphaerisporangium sp. TRM90804]
MAELLRITLADGGHLLAEAEDDEPGVRRASRAGDVIEASAASLEAALEPVRRAAGEAMRVFRESGSDEIEIEFGVKLTAEAGAVIAKAGTEGHLRVRLLWKGTG